MSKITHREGTQIVTRAKLRSLLRADGERCYCAPDRSTEWDAGTCPQHKTDTAQSRP